MSLVNILALLIAILCLSYIVKEKIVDVIPVVFALLVLVLYVLAYFQAMSYIDYLGIVIVAGTVIWLLTARSEARSSILRFIYQEITHPGVLVIMLAFLLVSFCVNQKVVTWWDDYNFWATDVKSLFYLDGFAGKYANVAAEFGDYPPGTQMVKWWFLHFNPKVFQESLMFAGYYCFNLAFLAPLMRNLKGRNPLILVLLALSVILFPSAVEIMYCAGTCADLTMGIVYGAFLCAVVDRKEHRDIFYYGRLILYLMILVLMKSVGFLWVSLALIFLLLYFILQKKDTICNGVKLRWKPLLLVFILPMLTGASWLFFCFQMRRVAKLTGAAIRTVSSNAFYLPDYYQDIIANFFKAFFWFPIHGVKTWGLAVTPFGVIVFVCAMVVFLWKKKVLSLGEKKLLFLFIGISSVVCYGADLVCHLTIFAAETQYLQVEAMSASLERYGAPFTIGTLSLVMYLFLMHTFEGQIFKKPLIISRFCNNYSNYLVWLMLVVLSMNYQKCYDGFIGYRETKEEQLDLRASMIEPSAEKFLSKIDGLEGSEGARVLYLRDGSQIHWVKDTYVGFEASPVSVIFGGYEKGKMNQGLIEELFKNSHASYFYVDAVSEDAELVFQEFMNGESFAFDTLYRIDHTGGQTKLYKVTNQISQGE